MKNIITVLFLCSAFYIKAQAPNYAWTNGYLATNMDEVHVAVDDASQSVYTTGEFDFGEINFGSNMRLKSPNSGKSMVVAKHSAGGTLIWAKVFAGPYKDCYASGIAVDKTSGNIYISGYTGSNSGSIRSADTIHFGNQLFIDHNWSTNAFLVKIDGNGTPLWVRGGLGSDDSCLVMANGVAVDAQGNPYITGTLSKNATFGSHNIISNNYPNLDFFVVKYDKDGNEQWVRQSETGKAQAGIGNVIAIDKSGNILVGCNFGDLSSSNSARALIKYDNTATFAWEKEDGIWQGSSYTQSVSTDDSGNIYTSGIKAVATVKPSNTAYKNVFYLEKFNAAGDSQWMVILDSNVHVGYYFKTTSDAAGNIYGLFGILGTTGYNYNIGNYSNTINCNSIFGYAMVSTVIKWNTAGTVQWGKSTLPNSGMYSFSMCQGFDLALDNVGNVYTVGRFQDTAYFDNLKAFGGVGEWGLYTAKLGSNAPSGIYNVATSNDIFIYPNPAYDMITIDNADYNKNTNLYIYDAAGKQVYMQKVLSTKTNIDISNYSNGVYMLLLNDGNGTRKSKFVVGK